ncbi:hypothetical protein [Actinomadura oligospora]|uniref:hypothetical protein n=1 Tax=Actinomadura oligospora TaxID=111804 RepID=UPI00047ACC81|nr:hypothetical protein [Actinomadura oligospora]
MSRPATRSRRPSQGRPPRGERPRGGSGRPDAGHDDVPPPQGEPYDDYAQGGYPQGGYDVQAQGGPREDSRSDAQAQGRRPKPKRGPSARTYFGWAMGLALLLVVGVAALLVGTHDTRAKPNAGDDGSAEATSPTGVTPSTYSSSPSGRAYAGIEKRSADAAPLTTGEAFPPDASTIQVSRKVRLTLKGKELGSGCAPAVWGTATARALKRAGCTQVARTLYADTAHGYALSVTVFNLVDASSANGLVDALGQGSGGGFVRPLTVEANASKGSADAKGAGGSLGTFGQNGYGAARGVAMGHFAVVAWAQRLSGSGDAASAAKDETLLSILIEGQKAPAVLDRAARTH